MKISVFIGDKLASEMRHFPKEDLAKIHFFIQHVRHYGFDGLPGRNKRSDDVPKDDPQWLAKVRYAQQHHLWHYHIGIPRYEGDICGDQTSQYILHYIKGDGYIKIVDFTPHPPFALPHPTYL